MRLHAVGPLAALALVASDLHPAVGEPVRLFAAWAGEWPAELAWTGVDRDDGLEAVVTPTAPGPLTVRAGEATITLDVQPAANAGTTVLRPAVLPLPTIDAGRCRDDRYPALAGAWVLSCSSTGRVDRARHLETREEVSLTTGAVAPGLAPGVVLHPTGARTLLPSPGPEAESVRLPEGLVGPPAADGVHGAFAWADRVEAFDLSERARTRTEARPLPWYPTALAWPLAAWVEDGGLTGEDVWARDPAGTRAPLARSARSERHVTGAGRWLAWLDEAGVYVQDTVAGERRVYAADAGFSTGLTAWGPVVCWEDRGALRAGGGDVDLLCSDGLEVRRPGHQRAPSRFGPWLLFREDDRVMVATATELVLDDDDPRASAGGRTVAGGYRGAHRDSPVSWTFDWPASGWRVERWDGRAWVPGEALPVGTVTVTSDRGDALRLVPTPP